jgi:prepilin-type N-terminal cleavage/methylation domain-containing protein
MIALSLSHPERTRRRRPRGFTLAELAVALVILALLLAGALIPLSTQIEVRAIADTQRTMEQIREAIVGFALANGRLPCPANGATAAGTAGAGSEQWDSTDSRCEDGTGNLVALGVVPWATLGVPEVDSWGRRFTYRVSYVFADAAGIASFATAVDYNFGSAPPNGVRTVSKAAQTTACNWSPAPTLSSFALCTLGDIVVYTRSDTTHTPAVPLGSALAAVIVSHGRNGFGAFQTTGIRISGTPAANVDEAANASGTTFDGTAIGYTQWAFYSRPLIGASSGCSDTTNVGSLCEFDDLVYFLPAAQLMPRMVGAGRLP